MHLAPLGDSAVVVTWPDEAGPGQSRDAAGLAAQLHRARLPGVIAVVPAFASVTVFYDPPALKGDEESPYARIGAMIAEQAGKAGAAAEPEVGRQVELPVRYGGPDGPDVAAVAAHTGLGEAEVIARHSAAEYRVEAIGFAPGFPYLSGLPPELATPRRATPRAKVPAGTVGIGGAQTGVYPLESPGGWQLIGRTDAVLFDAARPEPALLRVGDRVKFRAVETAAEMKSGGSVCLSAGDKRPEAGRAGLRVVSAGMLTTVQDLGRPGWRATGVPSGGAADALAARIANLLVGNGEGAAGLEFTMIGPEIEFLSDGLIALGGAEFAGCAAWQPLRVTAGQRIKFGAAVAGCRGFLAVAGGLDVPRVLGSRSTYARAGIGGWLGRALQAGDELPVNAWAQARAVAEHWWLDRRILPEYGPAPTLRVLPGAQAAEFGDAWQEREWKVTPQSDRMGMRLAGTALARAGGGELWSTAVAPGTVQVPPDGQPIVLLADAQTIGGYPQLANVIRVDLPLLAQVRPGDAVKFRSVSLEEAHRLGRAREQALGLLREGLAQKIH